MPETIEIEYDPVEENVTVALSEVFNAIDTDQLIAELKRRGRVLANSGLITLWIDEAQTEEVKEVYDHIVESWHFDTVLFESKRGKR